MGENKAGFEEILEALKNNPNGMSVIEIAKKIHMNRVTVARYLDVLNTSGKVEMVPYGQAKVFYLSKKIPFSSLIDCVSDVVLIVDSKGKICQFNSAFLNIFGGSAADYYGVSVSSLFYLKDFEEGIFRSIDVALRGKEIRDEIILETPGRDIYLEVRIYPSVFENGESSVSIFMTDISEKKYADDIVRVNRDLIWEIASPEKINKIYNAGIKTVLDSLKMDSAGVLMNNSDVIYNIHPARKSEKLFKGKMDSFWSNEGLYDEIVDSDIFYSSEDGNNEKIKDLMKRHGLGSLALNPLVAGEEILGFFVTTSEEVRDFTSKEKNELELITSQISWAIHRFGDKHEISLSGRRPVPDE